MSGFKFGQTPAASTGFSFSAPATATTTATGFSFGATTPAVATTQTGFSFGTPTPAAAVGAVQQTNLGLGTTPTLGFGTPATCSSTIPTLSFSTSQQTPSFGLTTTSVAPTIAQAPAPTLGTLGGGVTNFNFSTPATTTSAAIQPFSFGSSQAAPGSTSLVPKTSTTLTLGAVTCSVPAATTTTTSFGLGGFGLTTSQQKSEQRSDVVGVKENKVPQEFVKMAEDLKNCIKQHKTISSEISRMSARKISNVTHEMASVDQELTEISDCIQDDYTKLKSLRNEISKAIQDVEMAKQTAETPPSLQFENTAPFKYFEELVEKYENDLLLLRNQIDLIDKKTNEILNPQPLTVEDMKKALSYTHECIVSLYARVNEMHRKVETVKEQYIKIHSNATGETSDPFADINNDISNLNLSKIVSGPSPFSAIGVITSGKFGNISGQSGTGMGTISGGFQSTLSSNIGGFGTNKSSSIFDKTPQTTFSGFGSTGLGNISGSTTASVLGDNLNLEKPPVGAKRNKQ